MNIKEYLKTGKDLILNDNYCTNDMFVSDLKQLLLDYNYGIDEISINEPIICEDKKPTISFEDLEDLTEQYDYECNDTIAIDEDEEVLNQINDLYQSLLWDKYCAGEPIDFSKEDLEDLISEEENDY